jgi:hypothetical protein
MVAEKLTWLAARTAPGDYLLQAEWPGMYLPLLLRNPMYLDVVGGVAANRPENVSRSVQALDHKPTRYIVLSPRQETLDQYPEPFRSYVREHYLHVWTFSDQDEAWARKN